MKIDITNIIEEAKAEKVDKIKGEKRIAEIKMEIEKLERERDQIRHSISGYFFTPKWKSDLLAMVVEIIEQQIDEEK